MSSKIAVIFSGCGVYDGSEINESVLTLFALEKADAAVTCAAPNIAQKEVIDHLKGEPAKEVRNVLTETARICRGAVTPLEAIRAEDFDGFIYVGGFGAAKNLSSFAYDGANYDADPTVKELIRSAHAAGRPQGFMCIAPVLAAAALGEHKVLLTIGNDAETAAALEAKGAQHQDCPVDTIISDLGNRVVSTPGYMLAESISDAEKGISRLVEAVLKLISQR
jgi:enhancing lycopene biosynthesis protein 2